MRYILIALGFFLLHGEVVFAQKTNKMIEFLVKKGQLDSTTNVFLKYKDAITYSKIFTNNRCNIYVFGTLSPHGKKYFALEQKRELSFLEMDNLNTSLKRIIEFLKKNANSKDELLPFFLM